MQFHVKYSQRSLHRDSGPVDDGESEQVPSSDQAHPAGHESRRVAAGDAPSDIGKGHQVESGDNVGDTVGQ